MSPVRCYTASRMKWNQNNESQKPPALPLETFWKSRTSIYIHFCIAPCSDVHISCYSFIFRELDWRLLYPFFFSTSALYSLSFWQICNIPRPKEQCRNVHVFTHTKIDFKHSLVLMQLSRKKSQIVYTIFLTVQFIMSGVLQSFFFFFASPQAQ